MSYFCKSCGRLYNGNHFDGDICQACYKYFRDGGEEHELPPDGEIVRDDRGYMVCHICGRAYKRMGSHARESHQMTIAEYKEKFGLCRRSKTTEQSYSNLMHNYAYANGMPKQLLESGNKTRIQPGDKTMRKGKAVRLQECIDKKKRSKEAAKLN